MWMVVMTKMNVRNLKLMKKRCYSCYYYEQSNLSLRNCILSFHDQINESLNIEFRFHFLSILKIPKAINNVQKNV